MKEEVYEENTSLALTTKENIIVRFLKWVRQAFKKEEKILSIDNVANIENIMVPTNVKMEKNESDKNSVETLYLLSENELEKLQKKYQNEIDEVVNDILKLEEDIQNYREEIKSVQEKGIISE